MRRNRATVRGNLRFVLTSPEPDNFTFEIRNLDEVAQWVATVAGCQLENAQRYLAEPRRDGLLRARLDSATAARWLWSRRSPPFGKRLGWYALARALRPRVIIEIGAHDGLGSILLLRALERNEQEGHPGRLVSFDINPNAGWLVGEHRLWDLRIECSDAGLPRILQTIGPLDMFVYDGWHSYEAERMDLDAAAASLSRGGVLVSDDAQITRALHDLCEDRNWPYAEIHEVPVDHFHPGATLGAGRHAPG